MLLLETWGFRSSEEHKQRISWALGTTAPLILGPRLFRDQEKTSFRFLEMDWVDLQIPLWMHTLEFYYPDPLGLINSSPHKRTTIKGPRSRSNAGYSPSFRDLGGCCVNTCDTATDETGRQASTDGPLSLNRLRNRKWPGGFEMCFSLSTLKLPFNNKHKRLTNTPGSPLSACVASQVPAGLCFTLTFDCRLLQCK